MTKADADKATWGDGYAEMIESMVHIATVRIITIESVSRSTYRSVRVPKTPFATHVFAGDATTDAAESALKELRHQ